ncbi:MAG: HNH endonuclease, partial [Defluviitaleaceae bacterium]|nr:HNH endonuclease [Defluviitaleaceae bacterium]
TPEMYANLKPTMIKKGHRPNNALLVGTKRKDDDGYWKVKTAEPNHWELIHVQTWERAHGKRPPGHKIFFLDGNRDNCELENLACVTDAQHLAITRNNLRSPDPELTAAGVLAAKILTKAIERERGRTGAVKRERLQTETRRSFFRVKTGLRSMTMQ